MTGNYDSAPVHPHPHVLSRNQERVTVVAEPVAEFPVDTDPLAHRDPACQIDITVAPFRVCTERTPCLFEQDRNTFPGNLFCHRVAGSFLHDIGSFLFFVVLNYQRVG
jgi:hypothetical protein